MTRPSTFSSSLILKVPNSSFRIKMELTVVITRNCNPRYTWSILCEWLLKESIDFHLFCLLLTHNSGHSHDPFKMGWRRAVRKWTEPNKMIFCGCLNLIHFSEFNVLAGRNVESKNLTNTFQNEIYHLSMWSILLTSISLKCFDEIGLIVLWRPEF